MNTSTYLARVIGLYLVLVSAAMLINLPLFLNQVSLLIQNASLMYFAGFTTMILGLLLVVGHNIWEWSWRLIVTLFGWIVLLKGVSLLFYPQFLGMLSVRFVNDATLAYYVAVIDLVLGLVLCYNGFRRKK